jgi:hypothetical protein
MTLLTKTIRRELPRQFDRRSWIVEVHPGFVRFRAKRCKRTYDISWDAIWNRTMLIEAERVRLERRERRAKRK